MDSSCSNVLLAQLMSHKLGVSVTATGCEAYTFRDEGGQFNIVIPGESHDQLLIRGYLLHEIAHARFTDFDKFETIRSDLTRTCFNIVEDVRIETRLKRLYEGSGYYLDELARTIFSPDAIEVPSFEAVDNILNYLLAKSRGYDTSADKIKKCGGIPDGITSILDEFAIVPPVLANTDAAMSFACVIADYIRDLYKSAQSSSGSNSSSSGSESGSDSPSSSSGSESGSGSNSSSSSDSSNSSSSDSSNSSSSDSSNSSSSDSSNSSSSGSVASQNFWGLTNKKLQLDGDPHGDYRQGRFDLEERAKTQIRRDAVYHDPVVTGEGTDYAFAVMPQEKFRRALAMTGRMSNILSVIVQARARGLGEAARLGRLDVSRLPQVRTRPNSATIFKGYKTVRAPNAHVIVLLDGSGSMTRSNLELESMANVAFILSLRKLRGVRAESYVFFGNAVRPVPVNRSPETKCLLVDSTGCTPVAQVTKYLVQKFSRGENNILLICTDGEFSDEMEFTFDIPEFLDRVHIGVIGVGPSAKPPAVKGIPTVTCPKFEDLPKNLFTLVKGLL